MGWIPTKEEIQAEVDNYNNLTFFKKTKNVLVTFILVITGLSLLLAGELNVEIWAVLLYLPLVFFIYLNHRWAILLFGLLYVGDKIILIMAGYFAIPQIIFGMIAVLVSYQSFKVASGLKNVNESN